MYSICHNVTASYQSGKSKAANCYIGYLMDVFNIQHVERVWKKKSDWPKLESPIHAYGIQAQQSATQIVTKHDCYMTNVIYICACSL